MIPKDIKVIYKFTKDVAWGDCYSFIVYFRLMLHVLSPDNVMIFLMQRKSEYCGLGLIRTSLSDALGHGAKSGFEVTKSPKVVRVRSLQN